MAAHKRNLTDDMIREMVRRECLIGLNYFVAFLREDGTWRARTTCTAMWTTSSPWVRRSAWPWAPTSTVPSSPSAWIPPPRRPGIYEYLLSRNIPEAVASGILYQNALDFFRRNSL